MGDVDKNEDVDYFTVGFLNIDSTVFINFIDFSGLFIFEIRERH